MKSQYMIVYYWRPACSCGWKGERVFRLGEEAESNAAFDKHPCAREAKLVFFDQNSPEMKRRIAAGVVPR